MVIENDSQLVSAGTLRAVNVDGTAVQSARPANPLPLGNIANGSEGSPFPSYDGMELAGWGYLHLQ